jgi:moderate conductance mechanosensitive channel
MTEELTRIQEWLLIHGLRVLLILLLSVVAYFLLGKLTRIIAKRIKALDEVDGSSLDRRTDTISTILHRTGAVVIVATAVITILQEIGVPIAPMLASVGAVGLALSLGAQTLVKDVISGLFILGENQYTIGEVVSINNITGTVEEMSLRATALRDASGALHIIPNGEVRIVSNRTRDWSRAIVDVSITYEADVDRALTALQAIGAALADDETIAPLLLEPAEVTGVEELADWSVRLRLMVKTQPNQHWAVQRHLRRVIHRSFAEQGIDLAFPRQEVALIQPAKEAEA